jgi:FkbM family methyltransferase
MNASVVECIGVVLIIIFVVLVALVLRFARARSSSYDAIGGGVVADGGAIGGGRAHHPYKPTSDTTGDDHLHTDMITVGEPGNNGAPVAGYDDNFQFYVLRNDTIIRHKLKKGDLFDKENIIALWAYLPRDRSGVLLDVGANIGSVSIPLTKRADEVSFEPQKVIYDLMVKNIELNARRNIQPHNLAVGHFTGRAYLDARIVEPDGAVVPLDYSGRRRLNYGSVRLGVGSEPVDMVTLDSLALPRVSAMKVDVEGAEPLVFYGAQQTIRDQRPVILFEHNFQRLETDAAEALRLTEEVLSFDIVDFCERNGYARIIELPLENYLLVPAGREPSFDPKFKVVPVRAFRGDAFPRTALKKFRMLKPYYNGKAVGGAAGPYIRIIVKVAKGGIMVDAQVLAELCSAAAPRAVVAIMGEVDSAERTRRADLQFYIEHATCDFPATHSYLLVNHEFFFDWDLQAVSGRGRCCEAALCKTAHAQKLLESMGVPTLLTKFTTPAATTTESLTVNVTANAVAHDTTLLIHLAGTSMLKGTEALLRAWVGGGGLDIAGVTLFVTRELGPLHSSPDITYWNSLAHAPLAQFRTSGGIVVKNVETYGNIVMCRHRVDDDTFADLVASAAYHVCPSATEGWGHIINQARAAGAVVIAPDLAPMNELVDAESGVLIPTTESSTASVGNTLRMYRKYYPPIIASSAVTHVDAPALMGAIKRALQLTDAERARMGRAARARYDADTAYFEASMKHLVNSVLTSC